MGNEKQLAEATKIVEAKFGLCVHVAVYVLVNAALIGVNLATNPDRLWFQWPLIGWGAGLILHAVLTWISVKGRSIKDWMIAREMKKRAVQKP